MNEDGDSSKMKEDQDEDELDSESQEMGDDDAEPDKPTVSGMHPPSSIAMLVLIPGLSREVLSHPAQRALAKERKLQRPNGMTS